MKIKHLYTAGLLGLLLTASSCEKEFLEVNQDPNRPLNSTVQTVLPTALGYTAYTMGNQYQILGGFWAQYWTQGPTANQYNNLDRYVITSDDYNRPWSDLYSGPLRDLQYVYDEGLKLKNNASGSALDKVRGGNYAAVARIMQAYIFQTLTDLYGDIPFTKALQGATESGGNITPRYESQPEVYDGLIRMLDEAAALADPEAAEHPHSDDFVFEGDMAEWLRFANTLKLRVYLRQSEVRPEVAQQGIQSLIASGAQFLTRDAEVPFVDAQFNQNPLYMTFQALGTANILASNTVLDYLKSTNDPRIEAFFTKATRKPFAGQFNGLNQGEGKAGEFSSDVASTHYSKPSPQVVGPDAPVILMSVAESNFLQAEAAARGWLPGNAAALYEAGVTASFDRLQLAEAAAAYLAQPAVAFPATGSQQEQIKAIITQKWVAMTGTHHVEPWNEWRRTGYPDFLRVSLDTQIGNTFPARLLYPSSEETRNPNVPAQLTVKDRVWWDVR